MLLDGSVDAAWICGFPYLQHQDRLTLIGVPQWRGRPLYQSYLITDASDTAKSLSDLKGGTHAFSDPDSNSGYLVTASDLAPRWQHAHGILCTHHIHHMAIAMVVRSVAGGLTRSGSVDGYVWETLAQVEAVAHAAYTRSGSFRMDGVSSVCGAQGPSYLGKRSTLRNGLEVS